MIDVYSEHILTEYKIILGICSSWAKGIDYIANEAELCEINWGTLIQAAERQQVLPIVADVLLGEFTYELTRQAGVNGILSNAVATASEIKRISLHEMEKISHLLSDTQTEFRFRKGAVYDELYYENRGLRTFNDIDLFVNRKDAKRVTSTLDKIGYKQGYYSKKRKIIKELKRKEQLVYMLYQTHSIPMVRLTDSLILPSLKIDISHSMDWNSSQIEEICYLILSSILSSNKGPVGISDDSFNFLDCALHLYREATFEILSGDPCWTGVNLKKFLDIARIWSKLDTFDFSYLNSICRTNNDLAMYLHWVGFHTDNLLQTNIGTTLANPPCFSNRDELHSWIRPGGKRYIWRGTMKDRLFKTSLFLSS